MWECYHRICAWCHIQFCLDSKLSKQQQQKTIFPSLETDHTVYISTSRLFCLFWHSVSVGFWTCGFLWNILRIQRFHTNWTPSIVSERWIIFFQTGTDLFLTCPVSYTLHTNFCTCNDQITQGSRFWLFNITFSFCTVRSILF